MSLSTDSRAAVSPRWRRRLLFFGGGFLTIGILLLILAHFVLAHHATALVGSRLQALYGGRVRLREARVGFAGSSSVQDLQLFETDASAQEQPWATVEQVEVDVSLLSFLRGRAMPREITLTRPDIHLRFDRSGRLLTQLPSTQGKAEALPRIHVENGQIRVHQEDRPEFTLSGINGELQSRDGQLVVMGKANDPVWGDWTLSLSRESSAFFTAELKTPRTHITQELLESVPLIPSTIWKAVQCEGDTSADVTLRIGSGESKFRYRVALEPANTRVHVESIDLTADQASGKVVVEDNVVRLDGVKGRAADGTIHAQAVLDFASSPTQMEFQVHADRLLLSRLPASWHLPEQLEGRLNGQAKLQLALVDGKVVPKGDGRAQITEARLGETPLSKPIQLRLHSDGTRFHFSPVQLPAEAGEPEAPSASRGAAGKKGDSPPSSRRLSPSFPDTLASQREPVTPLMIAMAGEQLPTRSSRQVPFLPVRIANRLSLETIQAVDRLVEAGTDLLSRLPLPTDNPNPSTPEYLEANLALDDVELKQVLPTFGIKLPFAVDGRVSLHLQTSIPLGNARDLKAYRFTGTLRSRQLRAAGTVFEQLRAHVRYSEGLVRLEELSGRIPGESGSLRKSTAPSSFRGDARLQVVPLGDMTARLKFDQLPLTQLVGLFKDIPASLGGYVSGTLDVRAPGKRLGDLTAWEASAGLQSARVQAYGLRMTKARLNIRLAQGALSLRDAQGELEGMPIQGSAELHVLSPYNYQAQLTLRQGDLGALERLVPELRPPLRVQGRFTLSANASGKLTPPTIQTAGSGSVSDLELEKVKVDAAQFHWESDKDRLKIKDFLARLYEGKLTGTATVPLRPKADGNLKLQLEDFDVGAVSKAIPKMPIRLAGRASGTLEATFPPARPDQERPFNSKLDLQAEQLQVQGIPAQRLRGSIDYQHKSLSYRIDGEALGGRFHLDGQVPPAESKPDQAAPGGHLRIEGAQLGRLLTSLGRSGSRNPFGGTLDVDLHFRHAGANRLPTGSGTATLTGVRWAGTELAESVRGDVRLTERELRLRNLSGSVGQGLVHGQVALNLRNFGQSWFNFDLDDVEASQVLAPWPDLAARAHGAVMARLRGRFGGEQWYGSGEVTFARGMIVGVDVAGLHFPVTWTLAPSQGRGELELRETTAQVALGRVTARGKIGWGYGTRSEGSVRFYDVDLRTLLRQSESSQLASGRITGRLDFAGNDLRSLNDLTGNLQATMRQTQALQLPVLQQLSPFLLPGQSSSSFFQSGDLRARLGSGVVRIDRLTFTGSVIQIFVEGTVTLQGRLNLDVIANTGRFGISPTFLRLFGIAVPAVGPIPTELLLEAGSYLSNRVVHLRVSGTLRSPVTRVEPLSLLTEGAFLYFINKTNLPIP